uniref:Uncharacterized protein n=1 Tax=Phytophthora ramorum TaxID=164328 RepID=H3GIH4_PHYRM
MAETGNAPAPAPSSTPAAGGDSTQPPPDSASPPDTGDVEKRPPEDSSQPSSGESQAIILRQPDGDDSAENAPDESKDTGGGGVSPIPMGEGVVLPSFSRPRYVRMEDVDALFYKGILSQQTVRPETFAPPDSSACWTLPSLPDTGTKTYLVGVPATVDDTRGGGFTMNGYGGTTALIGFEEMNADDNSEFERLFDMNAPVELMTIETPDDDETSWRHLGILVQYVSTSRNSSGQDPGFPDYEVHKYASDLAKKRWDSDAYVELEKSEPWTVMFEGRYRVLFFHRRSTLSLDTLRMLGEIVKFMHTNARAFWECGHWVTIDQEADDLSLAIHSGRVTRRNALRRRYQSLEKRALATPGFVKTLLYEPGLWKLPDRCCAWIWQDPRVEKLGGPKCDDLEIQLAETDLREPARTQWNTASSKSEWLQYVPTELKARMLSASERKENLICTK